MTGEKSFVRTTLVLEVRDANKALVLLSNPIYVNFPPQ